jgi:hypothetical protein
MPGFTCSKEENITDDASIINFAVTAKERPCGIRYAKRLTSYPKGKPSLSWDKRDCFALKEGSQ